MKKGVELSMNVIIIAAIGLLVLVILAVLVINSSTNFRAGTQSCNSQGGICKSSCDTTVDGGQISPASGCTSSDKPTCCKIFATG